MLGKNQYLQSGVFVMYILHMSAMVDSHNAHHWINIFNKKNHNTNRVKIYPALQGTSDEGVNILTLF
jgi:hypothetical protein